jgi:hypothetical protein
VTRPSFQDIADDYRSRHQEGARRELRFFSIQRTLERAVRLAANAIGPGGKRFSHQRRIPASSLEEAEVRLVAVLSRLRRARSFDELHRVVKDAIDPVYKIGELMVYDTSLRIGAKLGVMPDRVYLHAGTRGGARALGLDPHRDGMEMRELPAELRKLRPHEAEDCLCIYKEQIRAIREGWSATARRSKRGCWYEACRPRP